jgi:NADPH:quinone reductase-like Zn-dependent oxidoreductase
MRGRAAQAAGLSAGPDADEPDRDRYRIPTGLAELMSGLGAHHVIDHQGDLIANVHLVAPEGIDYIFTPHSRGNVDAFAALLRPGGRITAIDEPEGLDLLPLKAKSLSWHWEMISPGRCSPQTT